MYIIYYFTECCLDGNDINLYVADMMVIYMWQNFK